MTYLYCCGPEARRGAALASLKFLVVNREIRTGDWSFSGIIERAKVMGHPEAEWLPKMAEVLAGRSAVSGLEAWPAWRNSGAQG